MVRFFKRKSRKEETEAQSSELADDEAVFSDTALLSQPPAPRAGKNRYITRWVKAGRQKDKKSKIIGKGEKITGENPRFVDRDALISLIEEVCNELDADGYEVLSIFPTLRGYSNYDYQTKHGLDNHAVLESSYGHGYGWGYGYSVTDGAVITARLRE